jgi:hypothetical protein
MSLPPYPRWVQQNEPSLGIPVKAVYSIARGDFMPETQARPSQRLSHEEYFALELFQDQRYEYIAGEVFAMTGSTEPHALISANTVVDLRMAYGTSPAGSTGRT